MSSIHAMPGHLIRRLQQISNSVFADGMKAAGVTLTSPQFAALAVLSEYPGIDQATLAGLIAHDRPTLSGVVERLIAKGLVERHTSTADRRAKTLNLTPEGRSTLDRLRPIVASLQDDIMAGLSPVEKQEFIRLAAKIAKAGNDLSRAPLVLPDQ